MVDDLSFIINKDGQDVKCDIISLVNGETEDETYIAFTDHTKDESNHEFLQIAKVIKNGDEYVINDDINKDYVKKLVDKMYNSLYKFAMKGVEE